MEAVGVVEAFDVDEQASPGLFFGGMDAVMDAFGFERVEEALHRCILPAIAFAAHRRGNVGPQPESDDRPRRHTECLDRKDG